MTEMKEKIYPTLPDIRESPSAPAIELKNLNDKGHLYRLNVITYGQKFLEEEIVSMKHLVKNIFVWLSM